MYIFCIYRGRYIWNWHFIQVYLIILLFFHSLPLLYSGEQFWVKMALKSNGCSLKHNDVNGQNVFGLIDPRDHGENLHRYFFIFSFFSHCLIACKYLNAFFYWWFADMEAYNKAVTLIGQHSKHYFQQDGFPQTS